MGDPLTVRRYRPDNEERVEAVMEAALRDANAYIENAPEDADGTLAEEYLGDGREFLVGVVDGTVVATGAFRPPGGFLSAFIDTDPSTAEIKRMHVAPDHQRQGCAQRILDELHQRARDAGYSTFVLTTSNRQSAAMEFYEANGFEEVGREHVELPDESFDMLFYEKSLVPENR